MNIRIKILLTPRLGMDLEIPVTIVVEDKYASQILKAAVPTITLAAESAMERNRRDDTGLRASNFTAEDFPDGELTVLEEWYKEKGLSSRATYMLLRHKVTPRMLFGMSEQMVINAEIRGLGNKGVRFQEIIAFRNRMWMEGPNFTKE